MFCMRLTRDDRLTLLIFQFRSNYILSIKAVPVKANTVSFGFIFLGRVGNPPWFAARNIVSKDV